MRTVVLPGRVADERLRVWEINRGDWQAYEESDEPVLALPDNRTPDWRGGTVALAGALDWQDYEFSLEFCLLLRVGQSMAWPGLVVRAQDAENYEMFWIMPHSEDEVLGNIAYLPVAHNTVPWWTNAYTRNPRGMAPYEPREWVPVSVRVNGIEASLFVGSAPEPALSVRLTYYLERGRVGVYCGTETSAKFRRMRLRTLPRSPIPDPPALASPRGGRGLSR